jgi:transposase-like protein
MLVYAVVQCPYCNAEVPKSTKEWDYASFHVKKFKCPKCERGFRAYYFEGKLSHTIPKHH